MEIPEFIKLFISKVDWIFAKTMPQWPHWYIVRENCDEESFVKFVSFIYSNGTTRLFQDKKFTYLDIDEYAYWTMGNPVDETIIINRAKLEIN